MIYTTITIINSNGTKQFIIEQKEDGLWISDGTGEGGQFNEQKFFEAIEKFYNDNF